MKRYAFAIIIGLLACLHSEAAADIMAPPQPISASIAGADIVVVARLVKFSPDRTYHNVELNPHDLYEFGLTQPGIYTFGLVQILKGQCDPTFQMALPEVTTDSFNNVRVTVAEESTFLLLLRKNGKGLLEPVDAKVPLIMLSSTGQLKDGRTNKISQATDSVKAGVTSLILTSLKDPVLRQINTYFLRDTTGLDVVTGLAPYIDDHNPWVRDNVLRSMAANQQVAAIPLIQEAVLKSYTEGSGGSGCVVALQNYKTSDAIPYLNPLLFEVPSGLRLNTVMALGELVRGAYANRQAFNSSSIPYLMLALRDPEQQNVVARSAYGILHQLIPSLDEITKPLDIVTKSFYENREAKTKLLLDWWRDELWNKHPEVLKPGEAKRVPRTMPDLKTLKAEDAPAALNPLLFERESDTARKAVAALETRADRSSVPYLLMALENPEAGIAFSASRTLHRLLEIKPLYSNLATWQAHREEDAAPLYAWWRDELLGNHIDTPYWRQRRKSQEEYEKRQAQKLEAQPPAAPPKPQAATGQPNTAKPK